MPRRTLRRFLENDDSKMPVPDHIHISKFIWQGVAENTAESWTKRQSLVNRQLTKRVDNE